MKKSYSKIALSIGICLLVGFLSGFATQSAVGDWYGDLTKPFLNPPNWIFGPVWTVLYLLMGLSAGIVWSRGFHHKWVKTALYHFGFQLILNGLWSIVFFGFQNPLFGLLVIIALWILILRTIKWFRVVSKQAAYLLYPYLAWVSFATYLNFSIWILN
ncbi:MAG: tryptophan-rich sensory protein [Flavobacteriaceae bacterium]|jgi:tryptophan-rich sensory protein|nr:tryptophan-rich sensory protein [Flavobacteriaceae bacterium]MDG2315239.1 tryptophan-rich sensory protein [Flavobacteriaceae bacterium]